MLFICNVLIGLSGDKTPTDFGITRSKGKVSRVTFKKKCKDGFLLIALRTVYHKAFIFHMLIVLGENKSPGVFKLTRPKVKVTWVICDQLC